jgi:hypothetical protein
MDMDDNMKYGVSNYPMGKRDNFDEKGGNSNSQNLQPYYFQKK